MREADILLHVVDISHPNFEDQINTVNETLKEMGALDKTMITVFNKIDAYKPTEITEDWNVDNEVEATMSLNDFKNSWMAKHNSPAIFISALNKENAEDLRNRIYEEVKLVNQKIYPFNNFLYDKFPVDEN